LLPKEGSSRFKKGIRLKGADLLFLEGSSRK